MMSAVLPPGLAENPNLGRWVSFPAPGKVTISTGKVEIGQGVLTAMVQIAAEELDVAAEQIAIQSGDTDFTPNEGFTAGSQSIQIGGVALRNACAEVRALFLRHAATALSREATELAVQDGRVFRNGTPTGQDYWTLAVTVAPAVARATGNASPKPVAAHTVVGQSAARLDLPAKVFGEAVFIHDMVLEGMQHARVVRRPSRGAKLWSIDEAAIRRAARGPIEFVRHGDFLAIVGQDEAAVDTAGAAASSHVAWHGVEPISPLQQEAAWLLQRPSIDRRVGAPEPPALPRHRQRHEATYTRGHLAHASIAPSCGLAIYRDGHLTVWTHSQGIYPLRGALAQSLALDPAAISVRHVQGPGCYGHNGADGGRRGGHRAADPGSTDQGALAPRGGIRLRAGESGDGGEGHRRARRVRPTGRLDGRDLERNAQCAAGQRQPPKRRGAAEPAARAGTSRRARCQWRRCHPECGPVV
jgi:nicotinate dehydrogenase subunit B